MPDRALVGELIAAVVAFALLAGSRAFREEAEIRKCTLLQP